MGKTVNTTLKLIAERVGVSAPTVSRVLTGKAKQFRISKETAEAINKIAAELNYTPNKLASGLRLKRTQTLGLLIPDISNPFFASIARSIESSARRLGYSIILCDSEESTKLEAESLLLLQSRKVDGLLICPVGQESAHLISLLEKNVPVVFVDRYFPELKCPYVVSDNAKGAFEATSYLIENGHNAIACIQGLLNTSPNRDRVRGFVDAHKAQNLRLDETLIVGDNFGEENGYIKTKLLLKRPKRPTAIFAASNLISLGALRAISEEGLKVPHDISLISFDDQPYSSFLATPMTTVAQQNEEMGRIAAKLLIEQIESPGRSDFSGIMLPTKLIIRHSVKRLKSDLQNQK